MAWADLIRWEWLLMFGIVLGLAGRELWLLRRDRRKSDRDR